MRTRSDIFRFGPFELDSADRRLMRGRERLPLPDRLLDMLLLLVSHPGEILSNDALWEAGWKGIAVTPNSVIQAVKRLRKTLPEQARVLVRPAVGTQIRAAVGPMHFNGPSVFRITAYPTRLAVREG